MKKTPNGGFLGKCIRTIGYIGTLRIPIYASHASFFIVLSAFPSLVLMLSLLRYTGLDVTFLTRQLEGVVPKALIPAAERLIVNTYHSTTGTLISISAVTALWSASRGFFGLCTGLNSIYGVTEARKTIYIRLLSVLYTFAFIVVLLLTLVLHVFGTSLLKWIPWQDNAIFTSLENMVDLRFFLLLGVQTALFTAMFMVFPNKRNKLLDSLPGALLASFGWLVFSDLYSIYVEYFAGLSNVFGSVYAVALSMLWLYCCVSIIFYGGAFNHYLTERRAVKRTDHRKDR